MLGIIFISSGGRKPIQSKSLPPIDTENEIGDDELEELALTFCSSEILNGMVDANWKTRLSNVQEFSQVCVELKKKSMFVYFIIYFISDYRSNGIIDS